MKGGIVIKDGEEKNRRNGKMKKKGKVQWGKTEEGRDEKKENGMHILEVKEWTDE